MPSAKVGGATRTSVRPEGAWRMGMISYIEHSICVAVIEVVSGTGISPCVSSLSGSLFPSRSFPLYLSSKQRTDGPSYTPERGCAHSVKAACSSLARSRLIASLSATCSVWRVCWAEFTRRRLHLVTFPRRLAYTFLHSGTFESRVLGLKCPMM